MCTTEELVHELAERYPEDADDLREALAALQKQKLTSSERLAKLNDGQWQRLGIPMGIETILREAVELIQRGEVALAEQAEAASIPSSTAPATADYPLQSTAPHSAERPARSSREDDSEDELPLEPVSVSDVSHREAEGIRRRGTGGGLQRQSLLGEPRGRQDRTTPQEGKERKGLLTVADLTPPDDLDRLWNQLLEDTLPPDKRAALMQSWRETPSANERYMMFLEYSSYLRKPEVSEEEKEERRKQLEPLMKEFGINGDEADDSSWQGAFVWFLFVAIVLFMAGIIYYVYVPPDSMHDSSAL